MRDEILGWHELVGREKIQLQRGMNFRINRKYSIILMSRRKNAPYSDEIDEKTGMLIYEGHDVSSANADDPKTVDQPMSYASNKLTENGKFWNAVLEFKEGKSNPELVQVYEKIKDGIWSNKGFFHLIDSKIVHDGKRNIFKFYLRPVEVRKFNRVVELPHTRLIPTHVKVEVWKRDHGKCVICHAKDNLHFDHDIPYSLGGSSIVPENVRLLCARHNLEKSDQIRSLLPYLIPISIEFSKLCKIHN